MWTVANKLMLFLTICICVAQLTLWYGHLPDPIPSHFNAAGQVDGEMGKTGFVVVIAMLDLLFLAGLPLLAKAMKHLPDSMINIPNREYWLAPDRRDATLNTTTQFLIAIGWTSAWLMIGIFHLTAEVAIGIRATINPELYWLMGIYLVVLSAGAAWICLSFRIPKNRLAVGSTADLQ